MLFRRDLLRTAFIGAVHRLNAETESNDTYWAVPTNNLQFAKEIRPNEEFGYNAPTHAQREKARTIWENAPKGPSPIDVAQYFLSKEIDSHFVERWPQDQSYNPLVVQFFSATAYHASNDMIAWCAAFVNWCLERSGRVGSRSPASQSFLDETLFKKIAAPRIGDLAVFTCYRTEDDKSIGLGHVGFVYGSPRAEQFQVLGGNQSESGKASTICKGAFPFVSRPFVREGARVRLKLNTFIRIV